MNRGGCVACVHRRPPGPLLRPILNEELAGARLWMLVRVKDPKRDARNHSDNDQDGDNTNLCAVARLVSSCTLTLVSYAVVFAVGTMLVTLTLSGHYASENKEDENGNEELSG